MSKFSPSLTSRVFRPDRRRALQNLGVSALALAARPLWAATKPTPVVVLTAYPDEVLSRFEAAFEQAYPQYRLQLIWRMPHDALPYLEQPGQGGVDVYWSASPRNFARLHQEGAWRPLPVALDGLPDHIGKTELRNGAATYTATEMAGYGFACNEPLLKQLGVPLPRDWRDLADPRLAGRIALPIPARVGFAPVMVDLVLQAYGWDEGWTLWSQIAAQSRLVDRGATFVGDEVAEGRAAVGLSIDFFVQSAIANGAPIRFVYPTHGGINPAQIAVTAAAPHGDGAAAFVQFVLSQTGQKLLTHGDIRKLPVRPTVYEGLPADYHRPFQAAAQGAYDYDGPRTRDRLSLVAALFQQMLIEPQGQLADLWRRTRLARERGAGLQALADVTRLLGVPPLSEAQAADPALLAAYRDRVEGDESPVTAVEAAWRAACAQRRAQADQALKELGV